MLISSWFKVGSLGFRLLGRMTKKFSKDPVEGLNDLGSALDRLPGEMVREMEKSNEQAIANMRRDLMSYPSPNFGSTYVRTYQLRHGWSDAPISTQQVMNGLLGESVTSLTNPVPYTPYVQEAATQTRWNRFRWRTVEEVVVSNTPSVVDRLIQALTILSRSF